MTAEPILVTREGSVASVTVNRPDVLNALNVLTVQSLTFAMKDLAGDDAVRCVVLKGAGDRAFIAGADIVELSRLTPTSAKAFSDAGHHLCAAIETLGKPVIAAINGFALGGGCELAMACTLRIAASTAKLGQPEISLGLIPGFGGTQRLPRLIGRGRALEMMLTGALITADEAWKIGLVNRVVQPEALVEEVNCLAAALAFQAPAAVRLILETVHHGLDMPLAQSAILEASAFGLVNATDDAREGTTAFLEKRKPRFTGR
jgi:enoyl-CoA hydratase/carnithine racemase